VPGTQSIRTGLCVGQTGRESARHRKLWCCRLRNRLFVKTEDFPDKSKGTTQSFQKSLKRAGEILGTTQSFQKSLKRAGEILVYRTVCWILRWRSQACSARVSCPAFASA
jgi:hypothetical protein